MHQHEIHVCRLKKALYGLKQVPYAWYSRIDEYISGLGFTKTDADSNLYYLVDHSNLLVLVLYVDDPTLTKSSNKLREWCKEKLVREFAMKHIGLMHYFVGLEVWQSLREVFLGQNSIQSKL